MAIYRFRCPRHGDFEVEQPMEKTTETAQCPRHHRTGGDSPKVLAPVAVTYTGGRKKFHG